MKSARGWALGSRLVLAGLASAQAGEQPRLRMVVESAKASALRLEARQAPLAQVLDEVANKTGLRVHHSIPPTVLVTATCAGETIRPVMACLLGADADVMYRHAGQAPVELWVLKSSFTDPAPITQAATPAQRKSSGQPPAVAQAKSIPAEQRANDLVRLAADPQGDEFAILGKLQEALVDEDADVRVQAVAGLARRGALGASDSLRMALNDGDPSVRLMAVDSAGTDPASLELLRDRLADSDDTVRALAGLKLEPFMNSDRGSE